MINIFGMSIPDIYAIILLEVLASIIFLVSWFWYHKSRFTVYLTEKYLNTYKIKKKLKISMLDTDFKWNKYAYKIDFTNAITDDKNKPILFYKYGKATPIKPLVEMGNFPDSSTFKVAVDGKVMQHLASRRMEKMFTYIIGGLVVAILIVAVYSIYTMQQNNEQLVWFAKRLLNITISKGKDVIVVP